MIVDVVLLIGTIQGRRLTVLFPCFISCNRLFHKEAIFSSGFIVVAVNPNSSLVYVSKENSKSVEVINGTTDQRTAVINFKINLLNSGYLVCNEKHIFTNAFVRFDLGTVGLQNSFSHRLRQAILNIILRFELKELKPPTHKEWGWLWGSMPIFSRMQRKSASCDKIDWDCDCHS